MKQIFVGTRGLRAGWRLLIFFVILVALIVGLQNIAIRVPRLGDAQGLVQKGVFAPLGLLSNEAIFVVAMLMAMAAMSKVEKRRVADYGWRPRPGAARRLVLGIIFGVLMVAAMYALQWAEHVYSFGTFMLTRRLAIEAGIVWAVACLLVGLFEEGVFRGYAQFTLGTGIGFWPAAFAISIAFGFMHLLDPNYRLYGVGGAVVFGLLFAFCLRRTGDLWLAVGIHAAVDYAELFIFAPVNSFPSAAHLLSAHLHGPAWLTGSTIGPEASVNGYAVLAIAFGIVAVCCRRRVQAAAAVNCHGR